jgi:organic hydroperoxide reductase OsmC/OhrA
MNESHQPFRSEEHYRYENRLIWTEKRRAVVRADELSPIVVAPPQEFGGEDGLWNPEQLLVASASSCLLSTFASIAEKARLPFRGFECRAVGHLTQAPDGNFAITLIELFPVVDVDDAGAVAKARKLLEKAEARCLIANSLKYGTKVHAVVRAPAPPTVAPPPVAP